MRPSDAAGPFGFPPTGGVIPRGVICLWSGFLQDIPPGWLLCDGSNGTPNLLGKFPVGVASATTQPGSTGGATTHFHAHTTTHQHDVPWQIPSGIACRSTASLGSGSSAAGVQEPANNNANTTSLARQRTNSVAPGNTDSADGRPPYYELAFIMKS